MKMERPKPIVEFRPIGINTYNEAVIYMRDDCHVCRAEGFEVQARVKISLNGKKVIATLNVVTSDILQQGEAGLSDYAVVQLAAKQGDELHISHPSPVQSLSYVRRKVYGNSLQADDIRSIVDDIVEGEYSDIHISSFLTAGAPTDKAAGVDLHVHVGMTTEKDQPLFTLHADSPGELDYALAYLSEQDGIIDITDEPF